MFLLYITSLGYISRILAVDQWTLVNSQYWYKFYSTCKGSALTPHAASGNVLLINSCGLSFKIKACKLLFKVHMVHRYQIHTYYILCIYYTGYNFCYILGLYCHKVFQYFKEYRKVESINTMKICILTTQLN